MYFAALVDIGQDCLKLKVELTIGVYATIHYALQYYSSDYLHNNILLQYYQQFSIKKMVY